MDFYIVAAADDAATLHFACRLTEKAYHLGHRIHLRAGSPAQASRLDDLLWTFRQGSFVPHELVTDDAEQSPVTIGHGILPGQHVDLLINLAGDVIEPTGNWSRLAEVIAGDEPTRALGRERFRHYRSAGCEVASHDMRTGT